MYDSKHYEKNLICDPGKDENNNHLSDKNCFKINMKNLENMFDVNVAGTKYFEKQIPKCGKFSLRSTDWKTVLSSVKRKTNTKKKVASRYDCRSERRGSKLFCANLYCKFKDCPVQCKLQMYSTDKVDIQFGGNVKLGLREQWSCPISGDKRKDVTKEFETGQKPFRLYLKKFRHIPDEVNIAGNFSSVGTSNRFFGR
ncbi:unnamed protein product [Mytilus coruscus]|uniref:Uncharacterized protein n=1 Tax=Mytilus coruscus TaxID=42192 RepID=A0A6J8EVT4_MYTCO|nr:unnamed protein product [Mytilus coruscus]